MWPVFTGWLSSNVLRLIGWGVAALSVMTVLLGARQTGRNAERVDQLKKSLEVKDAQLRATLDAPRSRITPTNATDAANFFIRTNGYNAFITHYANLNVGVVAYINDYQPPQIPGRSYFRHRIVIKFRNLKVDLWLRCNDDKQLGIFPGHPDAPTNLGWRLPYYSLITETVYQVLPEEIEDYYRFMFSMKPRLASCQRRWDKLIIPITLPF